MLFIASIIFYECYYCELCRMKLHFLFVYPPSATGLWVLFANAESLLQVVYILVPALVFCLHIFYVYALRFRNSSDLHIIFGMSFLGLMNMYC